MTWQPAWRSPEGPHGGLFDPDRRYDIGIAGDVRIANFDRRLREERDEFAITTLAALV
ncbi:MAG: hypothetical protein AB7U49_03445 [Hyphomicrobiaceae bacterium]